MNDDELDRLIQEIPREVPSANFLRNAREIPLRHAGATTRRRTASGLYFALGLAASLALGLLTGLQVESTPAVEGTLAAEGEGVVLADANEQSTRWSDEDLSDAFGSISTDDENLEL